MKKPILFLIGLLLCLLTQAQTIQPNMTGSQMRLALNNNFKEIQDVVDTVNETIKIQGVTITSNALEVNILDGALCNVTELNYLVGLTSTIQTQLNSKANSTHTHSQSDITSLSDSLLNRYTKAQTNSLLNNKQNTLVSGTNIKTINNTSLLGSGNITITGGEGGSGVWGAITGTLADQTDLMDSIAYLNSRIDSLKNDLNDTVDIRTIAPVLNDTVPKFVFGAGAGNDADSTIFVINNWMPFGVFSQPEDSLYVVNFKNMYITSGDSIRINVYWGHRMAGTVHDSLFSSIQGIGVNQGILTPARGRTIPEGHDVWIKLSGTQPSGRRPKAWFFQMNGYIKRD